MQRAAGQTLLELLLVLALLLLLATMLVPAWRGQVAAWRLKAAARTVRTVWREARLHAIEDNCVYLFEVVPGTGKYRVRPIEPAAGPTGSAGSFGLSTATSLSAGPAGVAAAATAPEPLPGAAGTGAAEPGAMGWELADELPAGVLIEPLEQGQQAASASDQMEPISFTVDVDWHPEWDDGVKKPAVVLTHPTAGTGSDEWVPVAMFYPEGMATDAAVMISSERLEQRRLVQLRGLTGSVSITEPPEPTELEELGERQPDRSLSNLARPTVSGAVTSETVGTGPAGPTQQPLAQ